MSAAAVNSQGGRSVPRWARTILVALNCGLGQWFRNPALAYSRLLKESPDADMRFRRWGHFWAGYVALEVLGKNTEQDTLVFVSDGGHHDNLGLSTLVERDCRVVVCVDAAADPDWSFGDLARVAAMLGVDDGWTIDLDVTQSRPTNPAGSTAERLVKSCVTVGRIRRVDASGASSEITLIYAKCGVEEGAPFGVRRYGEQHPTFPQQSTANQFFEESQFEAYRLLGEYMSERVHEEMARACGGLLASLGGKGPDAMRSDPAQTEPAGGQSEIDAPLPPT